MREILYIFCKERIVDVPPIILTKYETKNEIKRLAIYNIAKKTNYASGHYRVIDKDGNEVTRFYFSRR